MGRPGVESSVPVVSSGLSVEGLLLHPQTPDKAIFHYSCFTANSCISGNLRGLSLEVPGSRTIEGGDQTKCQVTAAEVNGLLPYWQSESQVLLQDH